MNGKHFLSYCSRCNRSFGVDTAVSGCCGTIMLAFGTAEEIQTLIIKLEGERNEKYK